MKYRGNRDAAALEKFIAEKLGHEVPEEKPAAPESAEVPRSQYLAFSHCTSLKMTMFRPWLRQASTSSPAPLSPLQSPKETPLSSSMLPGIALFVELS